VSERILGSNHCDKGSPFHTEGPTTENPRAWVVEVAYEQKEQRVTHVRMSGVNCDLWCPGWDSKDLGGRADQDPGYTSRPCIMRGSQSAIT